MKPRYYSYYSFLKPPSRCVVGYPIDPEGVEANFSGADLTNAPLTEANLTEANLDRRI